MANGPDRHQGQDRHHQQPTRSVEDSQQHEHEVGHPVCIPAQPFDVQTAFGDDSVHDQRCSHQNGVEHEARREQRCAILEFICNLERQRGSEEDQQGHAGCPGCGTDGVHGHHLAHKHGHRECDEQDEIWAVSPNLRVHVAD